MAWVTRATRPSVLLQDPSIRNDSILGWEKTAGIVVISLAEVTRISIREPDGGKTAGLVAGIVGGLGIGVFLLIRSILEDPNYY